MIIQKRASKGGTEYMSTRQRIRPKESRMMPSPGRQI